MLQMTSPYNIPEPPPMYAGSYTELNFELLDPNSQEEIDLTNIPNIGYVMTAWGEYGDPALEFTLKDNTDNRMYMRIDPAQKNRLTIYLYSDDTYSFAENYYDFQIEFIDFDKKSNSVVGQGKIKVFSKITEK